MFNFYWSKKVWSKKVLILVFLSFFLLFVIIGFSGANYYNPLSKDLIQKTSFLDNQEQTGQKKVVIIFNSGGWGNTPLNQAEDFISVVEGIKGTLIEWGYEPVLISYNRTKEDFTGRARGVKEFFFSFDKQSEKLAEQIEYFLEDNPGTQVIITGLSVGAAFVNNTMENLSHSSQVYAIEAGVPFWDDHFNSENILVLNNDKKDTLATGQLRALIWAFIKAPGEWIFAKISGSDLTFAESIQVPGHEYDWSSPEINGEIKSFLKDKLYSF